MINYRGFRRPIRTYHPRNPNVDPDYVIMDVTWIDQQWPMNHFLFRKFPGRYLLELVSSIPMDEDYDPVLWDAIGSVMDEEEEKCVDLSSISVIIEQILMMFYEELNRLTNNSPTNYTFFKWADQNAIMLRKE